ncbi:hypothetical protein [Vibrio neonatus]|uniref:hypothetical protein n=1 Tax=Vibrio neonatus TaxID=278860 RepID=UPI0021C453B8|nr:hypothetical protein [Vibrio neonatus]
MNRRELIPLQYCSFERASKMLCVEVEDLIHWLDQGLITPAIEIKEPAIWDGLTKDLEIKDPPKGFANSALSTKYSKMIYLGKNVDGESYHSADGIWRITPIMGSIWFEDIDSVIECVQLAQLGAPSSPGAYVPALVYPYEIRVKDLVIVYEDLKRIIEAINEGKELDLIDDQPTHTPNTPARKPRTEPRQTELIRRLLDLVPELRDKLYDASEAQKEQTLNRYLTDKGLQPIATPTGKTLANWIGQPKTNE